MEMCINVTVIGEGRWIDSIRGAMAVYVENVVKSVDYFMRAIIVSR